MAALLAAAIAAMVLLNGCKCAVQEPCFESITVIPARGVAVVFDKCNGIVSYQAVPPLPEQKPPTLETN